jgi:hypothetical protein
MMLVPGQSSENRFETGLPMIATGTRSTIIWAGFDNANRAGYPRLSPATLLSFSVRAFFSCASNTPSLATMNKEKLMKMASAVRTGGKGSVRRYVVLVSLFSSSAVLCLFSLVALVFLGFEAAVDCRGSSVL